MGKAVTYGQIKKIYVLAKERGMDDDLLHEHMEMLVGKTSIRELTKKDAIVLIDSLEGKGSRNVKDRAMAKQMYRIFELMKEMGWTTGDGRPDLDRLNSFLRSEEAGFNLSDYRWLNIRLASNLIEAFKRMAAAEQEKMVAQ